MNIPYLDLGRLNALCQPQIEQAALSVLRSGRYLRDQQVTLFEQTWAQANGATYCVSTGNGLDALTAAMRGLKWLNQWPDGSEVIVSAHTFIASFLAITEAGLTPVPCDVSADDYNINPTLIEPLITAQTVAVMPVHIYGRECRMQPIRAIADRHGLKVITDSCQRHCADGSGSLTASLSDAAAFSFYPGKNLGAMGDAGCLITSSKPLADFARAYCNYGAEEKYRHAVKGCNSRMDSLQAAILLAKLPLLDKQNDQRRRQAERYSQAIRNPYITLPYGGLEIDQSVWHIYPIFCQHRQQLRDWLAAHGIGTNIHYPTPPHRQAAYAELNSTSLPVAEQLCATELSLPLNPTLTAGEQDYIIDTLNRFHL